MIIRFRHNGLQLLYEKGDRRRVSPAYVAKIERILARLDEATGPADMDLPGFRLHPLKGNLAGYWSVSVSGNWRHRVLLRGRARQRRGPNRLPLKKDYKMPMKNPPHPGLSVRHDCLEPLGLSVTEAAKKLGVSRKQLSDVVNGRSGISPQMAIRLDKAFGGGANTWYRLQAAYDLAQAMKQADQIKVERLSTVT